MTAIEVARRPRAQLYRKFMRFWLVSVPIAAIASLMTAPPASAGAEHLVVPGNMGIWRQDFADDFNVLNLDVWGRYDSSSPGMGLLSEYDRTNAYVEDGKLVLRTYDAGGGDWRSAGVSGAKGFWAVKGKWAIRAKFDRAYGIGYAFLLYPKGGSWPPEVDFAEGTAGGPRLMSTLHWGAENNTDSRFNYSVDVTQWHTYGVIMQDNLTQFTIDGKIWTTIDNAGTPQVPMWIGLQAGAKKCPTSFGECVSSRTPDDSRIYIDWVGHWSQTG